MAPTCWFATARRSRRRQAKARPRQSDDAAPEVSEVQVEVPKLSPPAAVQITDNTIPVEISEYAGYAGLIAANGGLEPNENSIFFKQYGFKVKLTVSEGENWSALNEGKLAASVTTADVLAVYGPQFHVVVPAQIGFSRGADGLVVRSDIKRINALKGKVIATAQFTEVDFFIRYLAQEAGLGDQRHRQRRRHAEPGSDQSDLYGGRLLGGLPVPERSQVRQEPDCGRRHLGAEDVGGGRAERRQSPPADDQQEPAHRRRRARRAPRLRRAAAQNRCRPRPRTARRQPDGPRDARRVSRRHRARVQVVPRRDEGGAGQRAPLEPSREPRVLLGRDRRGGQLRGHLPVGGVRLWQP